MKYVLVTWPETLILTSMNWFAECVQLTDERFLPEFGPVAYFVPEERFTEFEKLLETG